MGSRSNESGRRNLAEKLAYFAGYRLLSTTLKETNGHSRKCKREGYMKARNYIKNDCDQATGKDYSEKFLHSPILHYACTYTPSIWCSSVWSQHVLKWTRYRSPGWENFGLLIQVVFLEVQKCDLRLLFLLNHINILFFPCGVFSFIKINFDLMGRGSMWDYFCPQNTTSIHNRLLPSTSAPPQYLIHCFQHEWAKNQVNIYTCWGTMLFQLKNL